MPIGESFEKTLIKAPGFLGTRSVSQDTDGITPPITDQPGSQNPFWLQHIQGPVRSLQALPPEALPILVAHSGAGPLLPSIAQISKRSIAGYIFVEAGLPHPGKSRLEEMEKTSPDFGSKLRQLLTGGGLFPGWKDGDLAQILPDGQDRKQLLKELQPRPLAFFEEKLPLTPFWPDAPCAYILFSLPYARMQEEAEIKGWPTRIYEAGHFHILGDPASVSQDLIELGRAICKSPNLRPGGPFH